MATLIFTAIGTLIGGRLGGAVGALIGQQVDRAIIGGGTPREGARLKELSVTTSSYGTPIPRIHGRMRSAGTIIWATDLVEHKEKQGGGKGKPSYTTYSYSASFAVALSSRPLLGIGRVWADGNLLRGAAGDLKAGGTMRFHSGHADQEVDPLLAAAEGPGQSPAYRGTAYVVFEDLQLGDFGNRIPALTFEIFADEAGPDAGQLLDGLVDNVSSDLALDGVEGLSAEGPLIDVFSQIDQAFPLNCDISGNQFTIGREGAGAVRALPEPTTSVADGSFGGAHGFIRKRLPRPAAQPEILRYYDVDRDYQPGLQRAPGRSNPGQPASIELPAAMSSASARILATRIARRARSARQTLAWRCAELDPDIRPGSLVTLPDQPGIWRVSDWEWRESGIELGLHRMDRSDVNVSASDPGRPMPPLDTPAGPTMLQAYELPWDGNLSGDVPRIFAAASSGSPGWPGAALHVDHGDGQLIPIGGTGRARSVMGVAQNLLQPSSPHFVDRSSVLTVTMAAPDLALASAGARELALGANQAFVGGELVQFANAEARGGGIWQLSGFLRGRGGTETAISTHQAGEPFVLVDSPRTELDSAEIGQSSTSRIAAIGLADPAPVYSDILCRGIARRPLSPVHGRAKADASGIITISWTRRARGAWTWSNQVETPLNEEREAYEVSFEDGSLVHAVWLVSEPQITIPGVTLAPFQAISPAGRIVVRQQGMHAVSIGLSIDLTN